jgi:hypothetical protein
MGVTVLEAELAGGPELGELAGGSGDLIFLPGEGSRSAQLAP